MKTPLRYPGGKSRALKKLFKYIPELHEYEEFREPFLGGGSVSLEVTKRYPNLRIIVNDLYKFDNFPFFAIPKKEFISEKTSSGLIFYRTEGHCWNVPSPCKADLYGKLRVKKDNSYYFFYR